jgi:trk system potassium uptake protein TrkA
MKVIIIGCGRVGAILSNNLSQRGHQVTVIDNDPLAFDGLGPAFKGEKVIGVGFDRDVLIKAGIQKADALAAVTVSDEANVVAARVAKQAFRVPRVAARVYDPSKADIYRRLGIATISPVAVGSARLAELLTFTHLDTQSSLGSGEVEIVEVDIPNSLEGRMVSDVDVPGEVRVISLTRAGKTTIPDPTTKFQSGDLLHLALMEDYRDRMAELFK